MPYALCQQRVEDASDRRGIVWCRPNHRKNTREAKEKCNDKQTHPAVAKCKRQRWQEEKHSRPEKLDAHSRQFFSRHIARVLPCGLIVFALPAVIEILELLVVVGKFWLEVLPQKQGSRVIRARV